MISIVISLSISNKFKQSLMQNVDFAQFQQKGIISVDNKTYYESPDIFCFLKLKHDFKYLHTKSATSFLQGWTKKKNLSVSSVHLCHVGIST